MCHHCLGGVIGDVSRRSMLAAAGAGVAGMLLGEAAAAPAAPATQPASPSTRPTRPRPLIRVCYIRPKEKYWLGWPGTAWNPEAFVEKSRKLVEQFAGELHVDVRFEPEPLYDAPLQDAFIASVQAEKPDGVLIFPLHIYRWPDVDRIQQNIGVPAIIFAALGMCFTPHIASISRRPGVYLASSADFELAPVRFGMKLIRARHDICSTRVAVVRGDKRDDQVLDPFGMMIRTLPRAVFPETLATIALDTRVEALADEYQKNARKVVEPSRQDILNAARNYFCARKIMADHDCHGITMDCLGLVRDRQIPTPPCMAWCKLLDDGLLGVCEADLNAVMSQLLCLRLLDKPGFIQDPVPDTFKNTFIGAHCVCATKLNGLDKPAEPFVLRSHAESDLGVSLQVLFKEEQPITVMQMMGAGKMILGRGKVLRNIETPPAGGCRTSVELALDAPADTRDVKGFHQLFIYGDHVRDFQAYGQMFGIGCESI